MTPKNDELIKALEASSDILRTVELGEHEPDGGEVCDAIVLVDNALRIIAAQGEHEGWRTMESAPRDGTKILVYMNGSIITASWSRNFEGSWQPTGMLNAGGLKPTHWRPLPAPPVIGEK